MGEFILSVSDKNMTVHNIKESGLEKQTDYFYHLLYELGFCLYVLKLPLMAHNGSYNVLM